MKYLTRTFVLTLLAIMLASAGSDRQKPHNLIVFIGDGMGVSHVYAAMTVSGNEMTFPRFPVTGFSITHSANSYSTDSAAGGTAIATGEKTNNRFISMRPDSTVLVTLMEYARQRGKSTGVISTSSLTDATPASFVSHVPLRYMYREIAAQYANGAADLFAGGGRNFFEAELDSAGNRVESTDVVTALKAGGYDVVYTLEEFEASDAGRIAGLMSDNDMPRLFEGRDPGYLSRATAKAIEVLSRNPGGFVLMVEGSEIDDAGHSASTSMVTEEILDMDRAVKVAFDFARDNGRTLVVVTADHETGGMSITGGDVSRREVSAHFSIKGHSGVMVPVFAYGPGAMAFSGVQDNTELFSDFMRILFPGKRER